MPDGRGFSPSDKEIVRARSHTDVWQGKAAQYDRKKPLRRRSAIVNTGSNIPFHSRRRQVKTLKSPPVPGKRLTERAGCVKMKTMCQWQDTDPVFSEPVFIAGRCRTGQDFSRRTGRFSAAVRRTSWETDAARRQKNRPDGVQRL